MRSQSQNRCRFAVLAVLSVLSAFVLVAGGSAGDQKPESGAELVKKFQNSHSFYEQFDVAEKLARLRDTSVLKQLAPYLVDADRHVRGNAAFVFSSLGDERGFDAIRSILQDRSSRRPMGQGTPGNWSVEGQIASDRYYAAHLFGDLKDVRAVPILIPLLKDRQVNWIVPWSLGKIGDRAAVAPLIDTLHDFTPDMRVLAIYALQQLRAKEALPELRPLTQDDANIHFDGLGTVAEAAKLAILKLEAMP
jgi:HEAT repeat protein